MRPTSYLDSKEYHDCAVVWSGFFRIVLVMPGGADAGFSGAWEQSAGTKVL